MNLSKSRRARRGAGAIELAIAAPMLVGLVLGMVDIGRLVTDLARASAAAAAAAELASQVETFSDSMDPDAVTTGRELGTLALAARESARPLDLFEEGALIVTAITNSGSGARVVWQRRWGRGDIGSTVSGAALGGITLAAGEGVVFAEVGYRFTPYLLSGRLLGLERARDIRMRAARRPRLGGPVIAA